MRVLRLWLRTDSERKGLRDGRWMAKTDLRSETEHRSFRRNHLAKANEQCPIWNWSINSATRSRDQKSCRAIRTEGGRAARRW